MTRQPHLFDDCTATITTTQPGLFNPNAVEAGDSASTCRNCGRPMLRTESGFLCCPVGHGKLIDERGNEPEPEDWPRFAARVAKRHQRDAAYYGFPPCECGACHFNAMSLARLTGRRL